MGAVGVGGVQHRQNNLIMIYGCGWGQGGGQHLNRRVHA